MAKRLGYKLDSFFIAPYGVSLNYKDVVFDSKDEIKIAIAGPLVNFCFAFLLISLWWIFPSIYTFTYEIVFQSIILALFNLLPCYPLDGGRIFIGILSQYTTRQKAVKITIILNIIFSILLFILFIIFCFINFNPSLSLCAIMLMLGIIDSKQECKYTAISLYKKRAKNFSKPLFLVINGDITLSQALKRVEKNRFTIFVVVLDNKTKFVDEELLKILSLKFPINLTFSQILDKKGK